MAKLSPSIGDVKSVKVIQVIEVERGIGKGVEGDPYRIMREYYDFEGAFLARFDTWHDEEKCCG